MSNAALITLLIALLAVLALAAWSWRYHQRLHRLDQRARQQSALLEEIDSALEHPSLSEDEHRARSEALLARLKASNEP